MNTAPTSEQIGALRRHPTWRNASDSGVRRLVSRVQDCRWNPGELILKSGTPAEHIYLLVSGAVRVFYPGTDLASQVTVKLFWGPSCFGDPECILRVPWQENVETLTHARVFMFEAAWYFQILQTEPDACFRQYWNMGRQFAVAIQSERSANTHEVPNRIVGLLASYARHFGRETPKGILIDHPLTQEALGTQVGATRRSVVRALTSLYQAKLLRRSGRRYLVPSVDALLAHAAGAPNISALFEERPWAEAPRRS